jgi:tetratricopeptide (TPR) repeat protein
VQAAKKSRSIWTYVLGGLALLVVCVVGFLFVTSLGGRDDLQRARRLRDQGEVNQALAQYQAAAKSNAGLLPAYLEPAEMLMRRGQPGDYLRAAELCQRGLQVKPDDEALQACAAKAWLATGDVNNAVPHLDWLLQRKPKDALPHAGMALVLLQQDKLDQAREQAQQAVKLDPDAPEGHLALGLVLMRTGQPQLARDQFKLVLNSPAAERWIKEQAQK